MKAIFLTFFSILVSITNAQDMMPSNPEWTWEAIGSDFSYNKIEVIDFNEDESDELLVYDLVSLASQGQSGSFSRVLVFNQDLETLYCEMLLKGGLRDIYIIEADAVNPKQLVLGTDAFVATYDTKTCSELSRITLPDSVLSLAIGDVNNDGLPDVVYSSDNNLYQFSIDSPNNGITRMGFGGRDIEIYDMGRASGHDIALYNQSLTLLNGNDLSTINEFLNIDAGNTVAIGDANNDGQFEVVVKNPDDRQLVTAYDVQSGQVSFEFDANQYGSVEKILDFDGDEIGDVVLNSLNIVNLQGELLFSLQDSTYYGDFVYTDFDQDGSFEFIMNGNPDTFGGRGLLQISNVTGLIKWSGLQYEGPYAISENFINDGKGAAQIATSFFTSESGYDIGGAFLMDVDTGISMQPWQLEDANWGDITAVAIGGHTEASDSLICYGGDDTYDQFIYCGNIETGLKAWSRDSVIGYPAMMKIIDLDGDEDNELLILSTSGILAAYQLENGFLLWQSNNESHYVSQDFNGLHLIGNELWFVTDDQVNHKVIKINSQTGTQVSIENTTLTVFDYVGNQMFGALEGQGFGVINPQDLTMSQMIYPTTEHINYLNVSGDGKVAFMSFTDDPFDDYNFELKKDAKFISTDGSFETWNVGDIELYDSNFPDQYTLYVAGSKNVKRYDLKGLNEDIFKSGFEALD